MRRAAVIIATAIVSVLFLAGPATAGVVAPEEYPPPSIEATSTTVDPGDVAGASAARGEVASTSGALPRTGSDGTDTLVRVGLVLIAAGGLVVLVTRRRATTSA